MAYQAVLNQPGVYRILLEERQEGCYVNVFESRDSPGPYRDDLQDDLDMAKRACLQDFSVEDSQWYFVPDEDWHAPM